jgi:hypothetical protein
MAASVPVVTNKKKAVATKIVLTPTTDAKTRCLWFGIASSFRKMGVATGTTNTEPTSANPPTNSTINKSFPTPNWSGLRQAFTRRKPPIPSVLVSNQSAQAWREVGCA